MMRLGIENGRIRWDGQWTPAYIDINDADIQKMAAESGNIVVNPDSLSTEIGLVNHKVYNLWLQLGKLRELALETVTEIESLQANITSLRSP